MKSKCRWCSKENRTMSDWEQKTLGLFGKEPVWQRLCVRCANRRLNNPYNGLLNMRKLTNPTEE